MFKGIHIIANGELRLNDDSFYWKPDIDLYEVFRVINSVPLFLDDHLQRLENSFKLMGVVLPIDKQALTHSILRLIKICELKNGNIRISFDIGNARLPYAMGEIKSTYPDDLAYEVGVSSIVLDLERHDPEAKVLQKSLQEEAAKAIKKHDVYDVILANTQGEITEGSRTNVFFVKGDEIITSPVKQVLPGVTRSKVLEICRDINIPCIQKTIKKADVESFVSAFFTGTSPKVLPISTIGKKVCNVDHQLIKSIMLAYEQKVADYLACFSLKDV